MAQPVEQNLDLNGSWETVSDINEGSDSNDHVENNVLEDSQSIAPIIERI